MIGMKSKVVPFPSPMSPADFIAQVKDRAAFSHMVGFTEHAVERMEERGITRRMVLRVLANGTIDSKRLKYSAQHASWSAPVVGIAAGMQITVVCSIASGDLYVTVITAYGG